ncbi:cytochrome c heme-lyase [Cryptococcus neoformans Bt1]|nr:cytochrome c heme-lyase [Cryptococcus neoformans var. grubii Bt1]
MWPFSSSTTPSAVPEQAQHHPSAAASADQCPVDHTTRQAWLANNPSTPHPFHPSISKGSSSSASAGLSQSRVISSIPRGSTSSSPSPAPPASASSSAAAGPSSGPSSYTADAGSGHAQPQQDANGNWIYPSEQQFFNAMLRKKHNPSPQDMRTIVPIHNAVNEKAWEEILKWESHWPSERCGGPRLVSFVGRPKERTPKAWVKTALGYTPPFDRHDWIVDRCGTNVRYVIDFYTGRQTEGPGKMAFYLDVRPAVDDWEGIKTRVKGWWS